MPLSHTTQLYAAQESSSDKYVPKVKNKITKAVAEDNDDLLRAFLIVG